MSERVSELRVTLVHHSDPTYPGPPWRDHASALSSTATRSLPPISRCQSLTLVFTCRHLLRLLDAALFQIADLQYITMGDRRVADIEKVSALTSFHQREGTREGERGGKNGWK